MKILLTCYYELKESLLLGANELIKLGHIVIGYPLYKYFADVNCKDINYLDNFDKFIKDNSIDIILWWYFSIPTKDMEKIVLNNSKVKNFMFNWDEPYNWKDVDIENKAKFFDTVFVTSASKLRDYIKFGTKKAFLQYPGCDNSTNFIIIEEDANDIEKYSCDISMCCTNLYDNDKLYPNQYIKRKELLDNIYNNQKKYNYTFKIYGPEKFKLVYPESYNGFVKYYDTNKVYNYSKINICTHVQYNAYKYLNERTLAILGSGGLLLVDKVDGIEEILTNGKDCIILERENYLDQIIKILNNYDDYLMIRHNASITSELYTWENWAINIDNNIEKS